jgi:hypothetical protein
MRHSRWFALALSLAATACGPAFEPGTEVSGVRILATRADKPYARPGETVSLETLAVDGRARKDRPLDVYWVPLPCVDPPDDLYYACFAGFGAKTGVDLTPSLAKGTTFSFTVPSDALATHPAPSAGPRYGLVIVFNIACPGHVEAIARDASEPQAPPIACFDDAHNRLGPDQWVFGFARVFVYDTLRNQNPVIGSVSLGGHAVDPSAGVTLDRCRAGSEADCPTLSLDVDVPASSQEIVPPIGPGDDPGREEIWVDWFSSAGKIDDEARLLYDPAAGKLPSTATTFRAPLSPSETTVWAVVHDSRAGVAWTSVPLHVR